MVSVGFYICPYISVMKRLIIAAFLILVLPLTSCAALGNRAVKTGTSFAGGDYRVTFYSGGKAVREWQVRNTIVNEEEGSDGWYFSCKRSLIRISGDVVVEPLNQSTPQVQEPVICN